MKKFRILCFDGGGVRGLFSAEIIKKISEDYGINCYEHFDLIVGTSTGAIIAGALALDISPSEIVSLYKNESKNIFRKLSFPRNGIIQSKYDSDYLKELIRLKYKNQNFSDLKTDLIVLATDIKKNLPVVIKSKDDNDISLVEAVLSSSSAPLLFDPQIFDDERWYSDGSFWGNNPSLVALSEAISEKGYDKKLSEIKILSIGTGIELFENEYDNTEEENEIAKSEAYSILGIKSKTVHSLWKSATHKIDDIRQKQWGLLGWGTSIGNIFIQTQTVSTHNFLFRLLNEKQYVRINFESNKRLKSDELVLEEINMVDEVYASCKDKLDQFFEEEEEETVTKVIVENKEEKENAFMRFINRIKNLFTKK